MKKTIKKLFLFLTTPLRTFIYGNKEIDNNKVFFTTYDCSYSCNPKAICEELLKRNSNIKVVWTVPEYGEIRKDDFPDNARLVRFKSSEMFNEQATSHIWIDNVLNCVWYGMPKKDNQIYINTWHGSMGIKKLDGNRRWWEFVNEMNRKADYCISNSLFEEKVYRETIFKDVKMLKIGHPRNDILFNKQNHDIIKQRVFNYYGIDSISHLCLYAPTFRNNNDINIETDDLKAICDSLEKKYGNKWKIVIRKHSKNRNNKYSNNEDYLLNGNNYPDMSELMIACDAGISDYSSWPYDYILTKKPLFIYAPDIKEYESERGLYYSLYDTPFSIATTINELKENIMEHDQKEYETKVDAFLTRMGCYEQGNASKKIVDIIIDLINNN